MDRIIEHEIMKSASSEPAAVVCRNCTTANPAGAGYCANCKNFLPRRASQASQPRRAPSARPVLGLFCALVAATATLLVLSPGILILLILSGFAPHGGGPSSWDAVLLPGLIVWIGLAIWAGRRAYWSIAAGASPWPYVIGAVPVGVAGWKVWTGLY